MFKNSEKGVSLIITFFVLVIVLAVVLSISVILYNELKMIRNIGDSVVAFYSADSGVEKTLYYDRKVLPEDMGGSMRGICNICASCPDCNCDPQPSGSDCDPMTCENCEVEFNTDLLAGKTFKVTAKVSQVSSPDDPQLQLSVLNINSVGSYRSVLGADQIKRAIEINLAKQENIQPGQPLEVSVSVSPNPAIVGDTVIFSANATGGIGEYVYNWTGDCVGSEQECVTSFASSGSYTATIAVTSGLEGASASATVEITDTLTLMDLVISPENIGRGGTVNLSANLRDSGGNPILGQQIDFSGGPSAIASCITGSSCTYIIPTNAVYKTYTIVANFLGNSDHMPASDYADLYVKRSTTLTADANASPVPSTGGTTYVGANLKSGTSNLNGKILTLKDAVGNILTSGSTGSDGNVILYYNVPAMAPGTYINYFTVSFEGDFSYLSAFDNVNLVVTQ